METRPLEIFSKWLQDELELTKVRIPTACCLSTIGTDGFPNARFVSFKGLHDDRFLITGTLTSRKGIEINENPKVALTFWWTETERQVRIQGLATEVNPAVADKYFAARNRDSKLVSIVSKQGEIIGDMGDLQRRYNHLDSQASEADLSRPANWGAYAIEPVRIEFLEFKPTRFHERILYTMESGRWNKVKLQP